MGLHNATTVQRWLRTSNGIPVLYRKPLDDVPNELCVDVIFWPNVLVFSTFSVM